MVGGLVRDVVGHINLFCSPLHKNENSPGAAILPEIVSMGRHVIGKRAMVWEVWCSWLLYCSPCFHNRTPSLDE